jgi:CRP/FNR family transcriptional regulator
MEYHKLLKSFSLFNNMAIEELQKLSNELSLQRFSHGEMPVEPNATKNKFVIILSGRMKIYQINPESGNEFTAYILTEGDVFSVLSLLDGQKHKVFTKALDDLTILHTSMDYARTWIKQYQSFNESLLIYLATRLRDLESNLTDNVFYDTSIRLAKLIFLNIENDSHDLNLINNLSHDEIAKIVGTTRAVLNRHLQNLKKEGIIDIERKKLYITDYKLLKNKLQFYEN